MENLSSQNISEPAETKGRVASVVFPIAVSGTYDYAIPERFFGKILTGTPVLVNLRKLETWGVVVGIKEKSTFPDLKEVLDFKSGRWTDSGSSLMKLYEWVAEYYQCDIGRVFRPLVRKGLMKSAGGKTVQLFTPDSSMHAGRLNARYREIWERIRDSDPFTVAEAQKRFGLSRANVTYLSRSKFLVRSTRPACGGETLHSAKSPGKPVVLTDEQAGAVERILASMASPDKPFLLHGITGSGKTHVYIEVARRALQEGRGVIILVPEIALTPQTIQRFRSALGDVITVIHSRMSDGERRESMHELVAESGRVVIGVRSAILAPLQDLGCIIVDEEHDGSYKQSDMEPRYQARDVAVMRGRLQKAIVVLGSATPSLESYHNGLTGKYRLLCLKRRFGKAALPRVTIVDMREEHRNNNWKPLSVTLANAISETVERGRQAILLLNRRGFSTMLLCRECGGAIQCPCCSVALRYHRADTMLKCHLCGYSRQAPDCCPVCGGEKIKYKGTGIQKIEEYLRDFFPDVKLLRMDQDSTRRKGAHAAILDSFADRKADILLGTQMVAKGLNFPGVALVGVIAADTGLHVPDFRASERTFQLLTQVAGRAGRTDNTGEVIIQTYCPDDKALRFAAGHDYASFFHEEREERRALGYPPYGRVARIVISGDSNTEVERHARKIARQLTVRGEDEGLVVRGPSPAVLERVANQTRFTMLLKSTSSAVLGKALADIRAKNRNLPSSLNMVIDVDPVNML